MRISNILHFCYGFLPDQMFELRHFLAIKSAIDQNQPDEAGLYVQYEPAGKWWERVKRLCTIVPTIAPTEVFGRPLLHFAHQADVIRLNALLEHGGIYLDIDTICLRSFEPLRKHPCVLAWQADHGLCNAVLVINRIE